MGLCRIAEEEIPYDQCPQNIELKWMTEVSSSIYATPLITDLYSDGRKDIIVPSFVHYLEVCCIPVPLSHSAPVLLLLQATVCTCTINCNPPLPPAPQVLEGQDGAQAVGWPAFHKSTVHASPLLYDIDFDGVRDIVVSTYNGEILFYKDTVRGQGPGGVRAGVRGGGQHVWGMAAGGVRSVQGRRGG